MATSRRDLLRLGAGWAGASAVAGRGRAGDKVEARGRHEERKPGSRSILVLGGTGFLGPQIVKAALDRGHRLTLFNRGKTRPHLFPDLEKLRGDRDGDLRALEGRSWDAVIDTSGHVPRHVRDSATLLAPRVGHYVFVSSVSVYADTSRPGVDESAPVATLSDPKVERITDVTFGPLKALCEQEAEAAMPGRVARIRPGLIAGPEDPSDRFTYWPARVARGGEILAPGSPDDPIQFIDVRDLGAWLVTAAERRLTGAYNALGPEPPATMGSVLEACRRASGAEDDAEFTWVEAETLAELGVRPWVDLPAWVPAGGETAGFGRISNAKAVAAGLTFRPVVRTARDILDWLAAQSPERRQALRAGMGAAREAEVLAALRARKVDREGAEPAASAGPGVGRG